MIKSCYSYKKKTNQVRIKSYGDVEALPEGNMIRYKGTIKGLLLYLEKLLNRS